MKNRTHVFHYSVIAVIVGIIFLLFSVAWDMFEATDVLEKSCQPEDINYESFDPYCIAVLKKGDDYSIFVGRDSEDFPGYGHLITHPYSDSYHVYGKENTFVWSEKGITWTGSLGHTLTIPSDMFTGGR